MKAFIIMGRVLKATYEDLFLCVGASVLWWLGAILVVTAAPATMGVNRVTNRLANYKRSSIDEFWDGARQHIGRGWLMLLIMVLAPPAIIFNLWFYSNFTNWVRFVTLLWVWVLLFFLILAQYAFPFLWQQDNPKVFQALRNSVVLTLRSPLYSLLMALFQWVLIILSVGLVLPLVLLLPAMLGLAGNFALTGLLQEMGIAPMPPAPAPRD